MELSESMPGLGLSPKPVGKTLPPRMGMRGLGYPNKEDRAAEYREAPACLLGKLLAILSQTPGAAGSAPREVEGPP